MKLVGILVLLAVSVLLIGAVQVSTTQVMIKDNKFTPGTVTINKGDTVTWTNPGTVDHTVKFSDSESKVLKDGASYSKTFDKTGTFNYICGLHPNMKGTIIVK